MLARTLVVTTMAALTVAAAGDSALGKSPPNVRLRAFANCEALVQFARAHVRTQQRPSGGPVREAPPPASGEGSHAEPAAGGEDSSSGTNVQEAGIDEPDVVKSEGTRIFALAGGALHAVETAGGGLKLLDSLQLEGWSNQLLVSGDRALAIGYDYGAVAEPGIAADVGPGYWAPKTVLTEIDISDPSAMSVVRTETIEGNYLSARLNGSTARVVVSTVPQALAEPALRSRPRGWRAFGTVRNARTGRTTKRALGSCHSIRRTRVFSGLDSLTVLTIDMDKGLPQVDADTILTNGELIYASARNLYVATQRWLPAPTPDEEPPPVTTAIHKFDASTPGETTYRASGQVVGSLLSQWSMSDHNGALRVASTDWPRWWTGAPPRESESFVTSFEEHLGRLVEVGRVGGLGLGERIYAVRFAGDTGYVVTFRQVDPLYTLDLSDAAHPRVAGELELRGYSAYLHPIGADLLLGVGQDATDQGAPQGTQLSLFDVSDPSSPKRLYAHAIASSSSTAEYDHHAFLWWAPAKLAVLPISIWGEKSGGDQFIGAVGFRVDRGSGIAEVGRASHEGDYAGQISRALVVKGRLFTLSDLGVELNSLDDLAKLGWVGFPQSSSGGGGGGSTGVEPTP